MLISKISPSNRALVSVEVLRNILTPTPHTLKNRFNPSPSVSVTIAIARKLTGIPEFVSWNGTRSYSHNFIAVTQLHGAIAEVSVIL